MPHPDEMAEWLNLIGEIGMRFITSMDPMDAMIMAQLARQIELAAMDYLLTFKFRGIYYDTQKTQEHRHRQG